MSKTALVSYWKLLPLALASALGCTANAPTSLKQALSATTPTATGPSSPTEPRGLAIDIEDGAGVPLSVRSGQTFWINIIDMRTSIDATVDEGVNGLQKSGAAASLPWIGNHFVEQEPVASQNADGTYTLRKFYRGAWWMEAPSFFLVEQLDADGRLTARPVEVGSGLSDVRLPSDDFFVRRLRAIQWTYDCVSPSDCTGASVFSEEALVEIRDSLQPQKTFTFQPSTTQLRVTWTMDPRHPYTIPVTQVADPTWDYGFGIDIAALTPPAADGTYAPGQEVTYQLTLSDGSGKRLHDPGVLPSYDDATFGPNPAGIYYYRGFTDPTATYYRRKHRERNFDAEITGPMQNVQPIRTEVGIDQFFGDTIQIGDPVRDGVYGEAVIFPGAALFAGAFDPTHAAWALPASDTFTFHIPTTAVPGTYKLTIKARRAYLGEDIPVTTTIDVQIGTTQTTTATLGVGGCVKCHDGQSSLAVVNHANADLTTCATCHAPLAFEPEGPVYVRTHFLHSRSGRFDQPTFKCANCHVTEASIQRTSQSACLSCHKSYPAWHVQTFGPITSMYDGGQPPTAFEQCTSTCHQTHPGSGLDAKPLFQ